MLDNYETDTVYSYKQYLAYNLSLESYDQIPPSNRSSFKELITNTIKTISRDKVACAFNAYFGISSINLNFSIIKVPAAISLGYLV